MLLTKNVENIIGLTYSYYRVARTTENSQLNEVAILNKRPPSLNRMK